MFCRFFGHRLFVFGVLLSLFGHPGVVRASSLWRQDLIWQPATLSCAGVSGVMADGDRTYTGAAAVSPRSVGGLPFGSVVRLDGYGDYTVEDTTAGWVPDQWYGGKHFDLYNGLYGPACDDFGIRHTSYRVVRYGWDGSWTG